MAIVDLMMPVMDGWQLVSAVREHPFWSNLFIIVFSATLRKGGVSNPGVAADICWPKPPSFDQLERVHEHCRYHGPPVASSLVPKGARVVTRSA
jgi:CheY-like chemotaxis protein